jgi:hypothetical protein
MRTHYNNEDEISLTECGCDGCSPSMIDGVLCHEHGCPDAWRDYERECGECGGGFYPELHEQEFCSDTCCRAYFGFPCDDIQ